MSTLTSKFFVDQELAERVRPTTPRCGGRPPRDVRIENLAENGLLIGTLYQGTPYAGDAEDPRPIVPRSLYDFKKREMKTFEAAPFRNAFPEDVFNIVFCNDRVEMPLEEAVPVPRDDLWWLLAPDDLLLLSDRSTHHYTSVYRVDTDSDRVILIDPWPERVFLKNGLNLAGVEAVVEPIRPGASGKLVSITRSEFLRVIVGIITLDTPEMIEHYLAQHPTQRERYETQLAFGLALMDAESCVLARHAISRFQAALRLAEAAQAVERAEYTAALLYVALVTTMHYQRRSGDALASKPFEDELRQLTARYSEERLLRKARCVELCSLGHAAGAAKDYMAAMRILDVAVARFPNDEEPHRLRAKVRILRQDNTGALDDLTDALAYNAERIRALEERHDAWHPQDRVSRGYDEGLIAGLKERRLEELNMRVTALTNLGRLTEGRGAAEDLITHSPDKSDGYLKLAVIEQLLGNETSAFAHMRHAIEHEHDPRVQAQMEALLQANQASHGPAHDGEELL